MAISEAKFEKEFANRTCLSNGFRDDLIRLQSEIADIRNQLSRLRPPTVNLIEDDMVAVKKEHAHLTDYIQALKL